MTAPMVRARLTAIAGRPVLEGAGEAGAPGQGMRSTPRKEKPEDAQQAYC